MQYKVQYLDGTNSVIRELSADTTNVSELVTDKNWPSDAVKMHMLDQSGRRVLSLNRVVGRPPQLMSEICLRRAIGGVRWRPRQLWSARTFPSLVRTSERVRTES